MSKILLDGYDFKVKAIRGEVDNSCPDDRRTGTEGYRKIVIKTDKGDFIISGCSNCYILSYGEKDDAT